MTRAQVVVGVVAFTLLAGGCGRASQEGTAGPTPSVVGSASTAPVASAAPSASVAAANAAPQTWHGKYTTTPGSLVVPKDWAKTHWSSSDTTAGVGDRLDAAHRGPEQPPRERDARRRHQARSRRPARASWAAATRLTSRPSRRKEPTDKGLAEGRSSRPFVEADKVTGNPARSRRATAPCCARAPSTLTQGAPPLEDVRPHALPRLGRVASTGITARRPRLERRDAGPAGHGKKGARAREALDDLAGWDALQKPPSRATT